MIKKLIFSFLCIFVMPNVLMATVDSAPDAKNYWYVETCKEGDKSCSDKKGQIAGEFKLWEGTIKQNLAKGAQINITMPHVIGMVAITLVPHGGYFCPVEMACETKDTSALSNVWLSWFMPDAASRDKCVWLCTEGYSGVSCAMGPEVDPLICDTTNYSSDDNGYFANIAGDFSRVSQNEVVVLENSHKSPDGRVVVGLTNFLEHGAIAAPIEIKCEKRKSGDRYKTRFESFKYKGNQRIICAQGYKPNADGTDCIPNGVDCLATNKKFCDGFPQSAYDESVHKLEIGSNNSCVEYRCTGYNVGFKTPDNYECVTCGDDSDPRIGINARGVCLNCPVGQIYNKDSKDCKSTNGYSRTDMAYGKDKTKSTPVNALTDQCWTKFMPDDYAKCVKNSR